MTAVAPTLSEFEPVLRALDWAAVLDHLVSSAAQEHLEELLAAAEGGVVPIGSALLAGLAVTSPVERLAPAVYAGGGVDISDGPLQDATFRGPWARKDAAVLNIFVGTWLSATARLVWTAAITTSGGTVAAPPARPADRAASGLTDGLELDEDLAGLPLLPLAVGAAAEQPAGRLVVRRARLNGALGLYKRSVAGGNITLDPAAGLDTWAHELAHALDRSLDVSAEAYDVSAEAYADALGSDEAYADALGPLLLAHRPTSPDAARALLPSRPEPAVDLGSVLYLSHIFSGVNAPIVPPGSAGIDRAKAGEADPPFAAVDPTCAIPGRRAGELHASSMGARQRGEPIEKGLANVS